MAALPPQWMPDQLYLETGISPDTVALLERMGHKIASFEATDRGGGARRGDRERRTAGCKAAPTAAATAGKAAGLLSSTNEDTFCLDPPVRQPSAHTVWLDRIQHGWQSRRSRYSARGSIWIIAIARRSPNWATGSAIPS